MQSSLSVNNIQPNFQAQVSKNFIKNAHNMMDSQLKNKTLKTNFDKKVNEFAEYGYDEYFIKYVKEDIDGKRYHKLIAVRPGMDDSLGAVLTNKDKFRKIIEKFTHINKYEFTKKMEQNQKRLFPPIRPQE